MEIHGVIVQKQETPETGISKKGTEWKKQSLVINTGGDYPQLLQVDFMNDKCEQLNPFNIDSEVSVAINLKGREYNGKYYTNITGWKIGKYNEEVSNSEQNPAREEEGLIF
tara:strand:+ start:12769 stop:13101 length:333 start_codon:yes stop_codon:yes gene_type:complete